MHYTLEVIMPPTKNIQKTLEALLESYAEEALPDEDGYLNPHSFYDWWVIGGRFSGAKLNAQYDPDKLKAFYKKLSEKKVTVSGFVAGKEKLQPDSQIPMVDALWKEYFPDYPDKHCPLFSHSNDQYSSDNPLTGDIMKVKDVPERYTCSRVIIAAPGRVDSKTLEVKFMLEDSVWNGTNFQPTRWDNKVSTALKEYKEFTAYHNKEYQELVSVQDDWICVTVDYHS